MRVWEYCVCVKVEDGVRLSDGKDVTLKHTHKHTLTHSFTVFGTLTDPRRSRPQTTAPTRRTLPTTVRIENVPHTNGPHF